MISTKPLDGEPLSADAHVLRLPKPPPDFRADGWRPDWLVLNPSSEDKRCAVSCDKPVRVSVWDDKRTTIDEARAFREGPTIVLKLAVSDVIAVGARTKQPMQVVYDPLPPPDSDRPGADGHAGIEGLEKGAAETKAGRKERLGAIADLMTVISAPVNREAI